VSDFTERKHSAGGVVSGVRARSPRRNAHGALPLLEVPEVGEASESAVRWGNVRKAHRASLGAEALEYGHDPTEDPPLAVTTRNDDVLRHLGPGDGTRSGPLGVSREPRGHRAPRREPGHRVGWPGVVDVRPGTEAPRDQSSPDQQPAGIFFLNDDPSSQQVGGLGMWGLGTTFRGPGKTKPPRL